MKTDGRMLLRAAIVATAIVQLVRGDPYYAAFCMLALGAVTLAGRSPRVSGELELAVLTLMVLDMTIGNTLGLYRHAPWFDKALHVGVAALIAAVVLRAGTRPLFAVLIALGVGAVWEIAEFGVDRVLGRSTQSAPTLAALDDTMIDLMFDAIGGVLGVMLARRRQRR